MRSLLLAIPVLVLAGCDKPPAPADGVKQAGEAFTVTCDGPKTFTVGYDEGFTTAFVKTDKAQYELPAVMAGSGARYFDGKVEFWEHHGEAMLNGIPGETYDGCTMPDMS